MRLDKLTIKTREALVAAQDLAAKTGQPEMLPEHVFLALVQQEGGLVAPLLKKVGADPQRIAAEVGRELDRLPKQQGGLEVGFARKTRDLIEAAEQRSGEVQGRVHLDRAPAARVRATATSARRRARSRTPGVTYDALMKALSEVRGTQRVTDENPEGKYQALEKYTRDLTELARKGKLDPVIGRDEEIRRAIQVLSRRTKNNPVLIGEPGVGKTAIVEGIAQRIAHGRRARVAQGQAHARARPRRAGRRHQVPRRVRGSPEGACSRRSRAPPAASSCSSTSCTRSSAPARPRARWTRPTCSSRRWRAASCAASAPPRSTSTASTSRRTRRSSAASSRSSSASRRCRTRSRSCAASRRSTRSTTASASATRALVAAARLSDRYIQDRLPARQGDRPHRRGRQPPQDGDRLAADADRQPASAASTTLEIEQQALGKEDDEALARSGSRRSSREIAELRRAASRP